uniref:Jasmonate O-methyltransferase n=1 Tax=Chenopodium quinoa TaxID=63459 RepID=A0A803MEE9_CHEQI
VPPGLYDEQGMSINKGNIYISETSPKLVAIAYWEQFEQDFNQFLKCRSKEVVRNGYMLLTLRGRPSVANSSTWMPFEFKFLIETLIRLVSEGLIKEEKLDSFDFPCYLANSEQLESIVKNEGSFAVENSRTLVVDVAPEIEDKWERAQIIANFIRAFSESLVSRHFGEDIVTP